MAIQVTKEVFEGLEAVRSSGLTNMFDRPRVIEIAMMKGFIETAEWVQENKKQYTEGIIHGFDVEHE